MSPQVASPQAASPPVLRFPRSALCRGSLVSLLPHFAPKFRQHFQLSDNYLHQCNVSLVPSSCSQVNTLYPTSKVSPPGAPVSAYEMMTVTDGNQAPSLYVITDFYSSSSYLSPHPLQSYIHLLLPTHSDITLALIIKFYYHTNLLHDLLASTYLKIAFVLHFLKYGFDMSLLYCKCQIAMLYTCK